MRDQTESDTRKLLLVVDASPDFRYILSELLEHHGYRVLLSSSADEALGLARDRRPRVIMGEHPMHLADGRTLCQVLRDDPETASIPFLALTARVFPDQIADAERWHPSGVWQKPLPLSRLLEVLEGICEAPSAAAREP